MALDGGPPPKFGKKSKSLLPLLEVLRSMKSEHRPIIFAHLDDRTRDDICAVIRKVLTSSELSRKKRLFLSRKLDAHKDTLRILADQRRSRRVKKKILPQIGGGPMSSLLTTATSAPLLLSLFR